MSDLLAPLIRNCPRRRCGGCLSQVSAAGTSESLVEGRHCLANFADVGAEPAHLASEFCALRVHPRIQSSTECVDTSESGEERGREDAKGSGHEADQGPCDRGHTLIVHSPTLDVPRRRQPVNRRPRRPLRVLSLEGRSSAMAQRPGAPAAAAALAQGSKR
jgi:hypothetical protein